MQKGVVSVVIGDDTGVVYVESKGKLGYSNAESKQCLGTKQRSPVEP
jgi:hypothetical protein